METLLQKLLKLTRCFKASLDLDRLTSNVSEILAIFERALNQCNTVLVIKCLNNVVKAHSYFPLRHLENKILAEPQPEKGKLPCCIRKAKLF